MRPSGMRELARICHGSVGGGRSGGPPYRPFRDRRAQRLPSEPGTVLLATLASVTARFLLQRRGRGVRKRRRLWKSFGSRCKAEEGIVQRRWTIQKLACRCK